MQRLPIVFTLLLVAAPLAAQQPDSTRRDTSVVELAPIEVVGSILPSAGPVVGSGVPARVTLLNRRDIEANEPRLLTDQAVPRRAKRSNCSLGPPALPRGAAKSETDPA